MNKTVYIDDNVWVRHGAIQDAVEELFRRYPIGYGTLHWKMSEARTEIRRQIGVGQYDISEWLCTNAAVPHGELISIIALVT